MSNNPFSDFERSHPKQPIHRKSKLGCKICKARKIKCDERRPVCGNCYRRYPNPEAFCEFESPPSPPTSNSEMCLSPSLSSTPSISTSTTSTSRSMELRLFHHFSTVTCLTMQGCEEPSGLTMWRDIIPALAFDCTYIYSAILGISALHLLSLLPPSSPNIVAFKAAAYQYIDETVCGHRNELSIPSKRHSLNRFTASVLITVHAKLRAQYEANTTTVYVPPVNYFMLQNGAKDMWHQDIDMGEDVKKYITTFSRLSPRQQPVKGPSAPTARAETYLQLQGFTHDSLPGYLQADPTLEPDIKRLYLRALGYLALIKDCILRGERASWIQRRLSIAPSVFGMRFCGLMREGDAVSLLIVARLFALGRFVDAPWWLRGAAEYEVRGLESVVGEEWGWGFEWPFEILRDLEEGAIDEEEC